MSRIEALTLDVTGTLIHCPELGTIYAEVLARHGITLEPAAIARTFPVVWQELDCRVAAGVDRFTTHVGGSRGFWSDLVGRLCALLERPQPSPFATAELFDRFSRADAWQVYPEVPEVLVTLQRQGTRLGIISNWDERLPDLLTRLDLARFFDAVLFSAACGVAKPDRRIFRLAAAELDAEPARTLHVGDSRRLDVEGALAAGMRALHLDRRNGGSDLEDLATLPDRLGHATEECASLDRWRH